MTKILLLGASGLVGSELLRMLCSDNRVTKIIAPTRRPLPLADKLVNPQGENIAALLIELTESVDFVFCCLGTTLKQAGNQAAFRQVDYDLVIATGIAGLRLGARHLLVVSAAGANAQSWLFYNRIKGEMEQALSRQGWPELTLARPSLLSGHRANPRLLEQIGAVVFRILPDKWRTIEAQDVAQALLDRAFSAEKRVITILDSAQMQSASLVAYS